MMEATHLFFIDDSGTKEYAYAPNTYNLSGSGVSNYFVFCGILVPMKMAGVLASEVIKLKEKYFNDPSVEIKSHWLRRPEQRQIRYIDKYGVTEAQIAGFTIEIYDLISASELELIASVVDKPQMEEDYPSPWYPPAVAYETLLMRVVCALREDENVNVIIDDTSGATPKGNKFKDNLRNHHAKLRKHGSQLRRSLNFKVLNTQKFVNSQTSHLVQLADLCAFNVHKQFQLYGNEWEDGSVSTLPMYEYFEKIESKFRHNDRGRIQGFGIVKMPARKQLGWTLDKK